LKTHKTSALPPVRRAAAVLAALGMISCAKRAPVLVPPAAAIEAVAGFGSASVEGEKMALKGKFAFNFRLPNLGRVEAFDPLGRMVYYVVIGGGHAYLVLPSKKAYAEEPPETLMSRLLGLSLSPEEVINLVGGQWSGGETGGGPGGAWALERDGLGRVVRGEKSGFRFEDTEFFPGDGVPKVVRFSQAGAMGRVKILSLVFNPPLRPEAFGTPFLGSFSRKSLEEILEMAR
jgi:hypothetical protein